MIFHYILLDLFLDFGKAPKGDVNFSLDLFSELAKNLRSPLQRALASKPLNQ